MLTFDDKYIQKRSQMMLNKPKHVFEGLYEGGRSLYKGVKSGVKSAFIFPKEGFEKDKDKYTGLLKGSIQGVASFIIKPIGGVFDATAKTAEGLKNGATYYDDKPNVERYRFARAFYEEERYIKRYDKRDAKLMLNLQKIQKGLLINIRFLEAYDNIFFKKRNCCIVLSFEYIFLIFEEKEAIKIPTKNIVDCSLKEEKNWLNIILFLKDEEKNNNLIDKVEIRTEVGTQETKRNRRIVESLQIIKDYYEELERESRNLMEDFAKEISNG